MNSELFSDLVQQLPDGIIITDPQGRIQWVNGAICAWLACTPEQLVSQQFEELMPSEELLKLVGLVAYIESRDVVRELHLFLCGPGDARASVIASIARVHGRDGVDHIVIVAREAGAREEALAETTRWAAAEQDRADALVRGRDALANALQELQRTQKALVDASRLAGMAQVATGILHNVGNVLNGVNVSAQSVAARVRGLKIGSLQKLSELLQANEADLGKFFKEDKRGVSALPFLAQLVQHFSGEQAELLQLTLKLEERIDYIKIIVQKQQEYAKTTRVVEQTTLKALVVEALSLTNASLTDHAIDTQINADTQPVAVDRAEVVHILVNLLSNAKHALQDVERTKRSISVEASVRDDQFSVAVTDNGVGIAPENRVRMFTYGFTTKKHGHGFGLHDAANAAKRLGGTLICSDSAPDQGATFLLTLPVGTMPVAQAAAVAELQQPPTT